MNHKTRYLLFAFFFMTLFFQEKAFLGNENNVQVENKGLYSMIGRQYLSSFSLSKENKQKSDRQVTLEKNMISDKQKLTILFQLFDEQLKENAPDPLTLNMLNDLQVFCGHKDHSSVHLHGVLDETTTVFGKAGLVKMLAQPLVNREHLQARQRFIKYLVNSQTVMNEIQELLNKVQLTEPSFFSYFQEEHPEATKIINRAYFTKKLGLNPLNKNVMALEMGTRLDQVWTLIKSVWPFMQYFLAECGLSYLHKSPLRGLLAQGGTIDRNKSFLQKIDIKKSTLTAAKKFLQMFNIKNIYSSYVAITKQNNILARNFGYAQWLGDRGHLLLYGYTLKSIVSSAIDRKNTINYIHEQLINVATFVNAMRSIVDKADACEEMRNGLFLVDDMRRLFNEQQQFPDLTHLVQLLQTATFKGSASFFSRSGRVLAAHMLMKRSKESFAQALQAFGELDACLAIAKIYKKFTAQKVNCCFVEYCASDKPVLELEGFLNPFISSTGVANSLRLNGAQRNILLTGSNMGGKSTMLKGVMLNMLLAQTTGIAIAQTMKLTPFTHLCTSFNVSDNIVGGESLFKAELDLVQSILTCVENTPENNFIFVGIDELFRGTAVQEGERAAYQVADYVASIPNCCFIFATHFQNLTRLAANKSSVRNMKMEIYKQPDGSFKCPYILEEGISTRNIARDLVDQVMKFKFKGKSAL